MPLVTRKLDQRNVSYVAFDPGLFPTDASLTINVDTAGITCRSLQIGGVDYDLSLITAVWNRRAAFSTPNAKLAARTVENYTELARRHFLDGLWATMDCFWLPAQPAIDWAAHNKVKQLALANAVGLKVPRTIFTNSPKAFLQFREEVGGRLVSKSLINRPVEIDGEQYPAFFTRPVHRRDAIRYRTIRYSPVIFQEYVPKQVEIRATIVGTNVFSAEIHSQEQRATLHDWRHYDGKRVQHKAHSLPDDIEKRLLLFVRKLGLNFGAADFVLTPCGHYIFLEINPNGQWGFVEELAGLPISDAIADLLIGCEVRPNTRVVRRET